MRSLRECWMHHHDEEARGAGEARIVSARIMWEWWDRASAVECIISTETLAARLCVIFPLHMHGSPDLAPIVAQNSSNTIQSILQSDTKHFSKSAIAGRKTRHEVRNAVSSSPYVSHLKTRARSTRLVLAGLTGDHDTICGVLYANHSWFSYGDAFSHVESVYYVYANVNGALWFVLIFHFRPQEKM